MDALQVARLRARFRLPAQETSSRDRLDRLLREMLDSALEPALDAAGISPREEVCVRTVSASVRLPLGEPDSALVSAWSRSLTYAIRATLQAGGPDVVRYGSRAHGLVDLLVGVAAGDFRRAWAWRQLGLWSAGDSPSAEAGTREAVRALRARPELAAPALRDAARLGALAPLVARITPGEWTAVARSALGAAALEESVIAGLLNACAQPEEGRSPAGAEADAPSRLAERIVHASPIARSLAAMPGLAGPVAISRALAVLAVLDAEPGALRRGLRFATALAREVAGLVVAPGSPAPLAGREGAEGEAERSRHLRDGGQERPGAATSPAGRQASGRVPDPGSEQHASAATDPSRVPAGRSDPSLQDEPTRLEPPRVRISGATRWGGLLFLLGVLDCSGLPDEILRLDCFAGRPFRWVLHRLALELLGLDERDPAALAFAGLPPGSDPPSRGEPPPTEVERAALDELAGRICAALHERLRGVPAPDARTAHASLRETCRREATVEADPGWFDVRLSLREVPLEVRRAGLDLDPGWVPWLGVVLRFVYE